MLRGFLSALLVVVLAGVAPAQTKTFEVTVTAGDQDRNNVPVAVQVLVPASLAKAELAVLEDAAGKKLPAQLTSPSLLAAKGSGEGVERELHFILPALKANATATFKATLTPDGKPAGDVFTWNDKPGDSTELRLGARPVLRYMYKPLDTSTPAAREETFKVYHHVFDPTGQVLLTKGPGGLYTHHRGLFYGFNNITYGQGKKADIWHGTNNVYQSHEKFLASEAGPVLGRHRLEIAWHGQDKAVFAVEARELTVYIVPGGQLIDFASKLRAAPDAGTIKLDGDPQHAGFHFRASQEVAAKNAKQTIYIRPNGNGKPGEEKQDGDFPWKGMSFTLGELGEQRYTVAYLDRPANPKPAHYSERNYGRFGSYFVAQVTQDKPLSVGYRVWVQKGEMKGEEIAAQSGNFVKPATVTLK